MKRAAIAIVMAFSAATSSLAQNKPQYVMGVTGLGCSKLLTATRETDSPTSHIPMAMIAWMEGYLSATNSVLEKQGQPRYDLVSMTLDEYWATIYSFCMRSPDKQVLEVIPDIMARLKRETKTP